MSQLGHDLVNYQCLNSDMISWTINATIWTQSHELSHASTRTQSCNLSMLQLGHNLTNYQCQTNGHDPEPVF